jgi:hypothetical protein
MRSHRAAVRKERTHTPANVPIALHVLMNMGADGT